ncbi:MAG: Hsp20/alpha crystallin family protein [Candidatus Heimdallarchaeota archaeon]|nr:Hsp20/alpha crystallin family protein [Candidatus Heimdallarchaeota archaeon]MDH5646011.1 Hsp20/alpha crystallin family protein [Candidatus Heimdallarchaeota archaeon]
MSLVTMNPLKEYAQLINNQNYIPVNLLENNDEFIVKAQVPGFNNDDLIVELTPEFLLIKAATINETETDPKEANADIHKYLHREIYRANSTRRIKFKTLVNTKKASSSLVNGILTVVLPKSEESKPVKLLIK